MNEVEVAFSERLQEIESYLDFLDAVERAVQSGPPRIGEVPLTSQQQQILYSTVYLQLYNLVEATATWCIDALAKATADGGRWKPADLSEKLRREWIRSTARTHVDLNYENRLKEAVLFCERMIKMLPMDQWSIDSGGGGNWDDNGLEDVAERLGLTLQISPPVYKNIKRVVRNDLSSLKLIKQLRNQLAHGGISFSQCGAGVTVTELKEIKDRTAAYLREVVAAYRTHIDGYYFLVATRRPAMGSAT